MMAQLNAKKRDNLPDSAFAIVKTVNGKKVREFPIHDEEHGRKALQLVASRSPEEKAQVRKAVCRKYPRIGGICDSMKIAARLKGGK